MSRRRMSSVSLFALPVAVVILSGCASKASSSSASNNEAVEEGTDANGAESDAEGLATSLLGGGGGTVTLASAGDLVTEPGALSSQGVGDGAKAFFQPAGCLAVSEDVPSKTVTYVFSDCTGPRGLVHVTGTVTVTYSSSPDNQLTVHYAAQGLKINGATINWTATGDVTANGMDRDMIWDGKFDGTTRNARAFSRTNHKEYTWTVGGTCLSVDGTSDGTVTGHELKTDVISFQVCKGQCPEPGSEIKVTDVTSNKVYDVKWNGATATYTGPAGGQITYTPLCAR